MIVLAYHSIQKQSKSKFVLTIDEFLKQIFWFKKRKFNFVNLNNGFEIDKKNVLITFDDGYKDNYEVYKMLQQYNIPFSIFLATDYIGKKMKLGGVELPMLSEKEIKEMYNSGLVYFGNHTHSHINMKEADDYSFVKRDILEANNIIKELLGYYPEYFVYPKGRSNEKFIPIIKELFKYAFRTNGCVGKDIDFYNIPRIEIFHNTPYYKILYNFYCLHWVRRFF